MAKQTINIGTNQDDGTGDLLRVAFNKVNDNFTEIYNELGGTSLSSFSFNANVISTDTTNMDIVLSPSGAGEVDISADALIRGALVVTGQSRSNSLQVDSNAQINGTLNVSGAATFGAITIGSTIASDLNVAGAVTIGGLLTANGSVDLGDTSADTVTVVGRIDSSLVPSVTQTNDLGSGTLKWRDLYLRDVDARNGTFSGNVDVTGNITLGGNITIGDSDADVINIEADIGGNLIPNTDSTFSVGTDAKRYLNVYGDFVHATDFRTADLSASGSTIKTLTTNTDLTLDAQGTGVVRATKLEVADVSSGQVITATTDGRLQSESGLTWDGTTLGATRATVGSVTLITDTISTTGGNIVINPAANVDFNSNLLINVSDPSNTQDAATKGYVDTQITSNTYTLTLADDTSAAQVIEKGEILSILGGADITSIATADVLTISNTSTLDSVLSRGNTTTNAVTFNGGISGTSLTTTGNITAGTSLATSGLELVNNNIQSYNSNDDIVLRPAGTGAVDARSNLNVTGNVTATGMFVGGVDTRTGPGAISLTSLTTEIVTTGTNDALTLANGTLGQIKILVMKTDGGDGIITPATFANGTNITMDAVHDSVTLIYLSSGWIVLAAQNVAIA
tara:strand:+ start:240 stop:2114 length:1875 start_codon:yes stop_codon:yes gene_type:complete